MLGCHSDYQKRTRPLSDTTLSARSEIQSMTGFASAVRELPTGQLSVELRSVNARFLDLSFRLPDELRGAEWPLRELITGRVLRGKVECRVGVRTVPGADERLDLQAIQRLAETGDRIRAIFPDLTPPSLLEVMRMPGIMAETHPGSDLIPEVIQCGRTALNAFTEARAREGERLIATIRERAQRIDVIVADLAAVGPQLLVTHEARLVERLRAAVSASHAPLPLEETMARIRQEVTLHGMRIDIAEEIDRLRSHLNALSDTCGGPGPVGKKLDFLLQEFNREANTLASKGALPEVGRIAVELKLLIEQIREQVQNLE